MNVANLFDSVISTNGLKNDAGLSRALELAPPQISKMRSGKLPFGAVAILRVHEVFGIPVRELTAVAKAAAEVRELAAA
jgi:hypothetical protein